MIPFKILRTPLITLFFLAAGLAVVSCSHEYEETATSMENYEVRYTTDPSPIPVNELFKVNLKVSAVNDTGELPDDIKVSIDGIMPAHRHGMNVSPEIRKLEGEGEYEVEGMLFHMPGEWQIQVYIEHDSKKEVASFDLVI